MIFDHEGLFSDNQAITATAASTNAVDFGTPSTPYGGGNGSSPDQGKGHKIPLLVQVTEAFDSSADDGTLTIALELDSTTTFTPDKSIDLGTFAEADLVPGWQLPFDYIPKGTNLQYARLKYTVAGSGNFTAGKIKAGIVADVQSN
jgi:hypothetical protein